MTNAFIAVVLVLFALDTLPCTPGAVRRTIQPVLNLTGLWQGTWSLFAPVPDATNHHLRARISLANGIDETWESPDWRRQSAWQRFTSHRHSEFLEKVWTDDFSAAWPGFAQFLAREQARRADAPPERVELFVTFRTVPPPDDNDWTFPAQQGPGQQRLFFTLVYPEPVP